MPGTPHLRVICLVWTLGCVATVSAQGTQSGRLTGVITSTDGLPLPAVEVAAQSPSMLGTRSTTTDRNGVFVLSGLAPGEYTVRLEHPAMTAVAEEATVPLGGTARLDVAMALAAFDQQVTVVATPAELATAQSDVRYSSDDVLRLPRGRTPIAIATLAPGVTANTPNESQLAISGGMAFDNVFLVDGVDIGDNLFAQPDFLFLEDAIQDTQVLTSGISSEYGRFSGGVVNLVTRSGGDRFSGSYRQLLTNPAWTSRTAFEVENDIERDDRLNVFHQATLGGPVVRRAVWFYGGVRYFDTTRPDVFPRTGQAWTRESRNVRGQIKLTGALVAGHTLQGNYVDNAFTEVAPAFSFSIDPATLVERRLPNRLFGVSYRGVFGARTLAEVQYSQKRFGFRDAGGTSADVFDSPIRTVGATLPFGLHYHAPFFDATDPEDRHNRQVTGNVSSTWSRPRSGSHDTKVGFERFSAFTTGGASVTATDYVFFADYRTDASGQPVYDANGRLIPRFVPFTSALQTHFPVRGGETRVTTTSFYVADRWAVNRHWALNLGLRYEHAGSDATAAPQNVDSGRLLPRLATVYDLWGNGAVTVAGSYGQYGGRYTERLVGYNDPRANPGLIAGFYVGPPGEGNSFGPGFDPSNYVAFGGSFPAENIFYADDVSTPLTHEATASAAVALGQAGFGRVVYVQRSMRNFLEDFVTIDNGATTIVREGLNVGTFDNVLFRNSEEPERSYRALQLQSRYRVASNWPVDAHWTIQLKNDGNFEGEFTNFPGVASCIGNYPEILVPQRSCASGRLSQFQRHRVRAWTWYDWELGRFGTATVAALYRYDSPRTYSLAANVPVFPIQLARDPGYATPPATQFAFFGARGSQDFHGQSAVDIGLTWRPALLGVRPYLEVEVFNVFDQTDPRSFDTTVIPNLAGPVDEHGIPTTYTPGALFGEPTGVGDYPLPRTIQVAFGVRF